MSNSKSCLNCGVLLDDASPGSICPTCLRSTSGGGKGQTLDGVIQDLAPTAEFIDEKPTADYVSAGSAPSPSSPPKRPVSPELSELSAWEKAKVFDLAVRGYRVVRKLGEGGFGVVFQAVDAAERTVAIKLLHAGLGQDKYRQRFALEANALTRLDAPGLVRLYHYDVSGPEPFLVTEYVPGGTLAQRLKGRAAFEPHSAADAVRQLANSVQIVHDAGLIHRDIKPSNILIGADDLLKLGDFGLVKRLDREDDLTPTGRGIGGTPEYSAPEQFRASGDCDGRADVYALGATLFRLLTGKPVFERTERDDLVAVILRVLSEEPVPPRKLRADIPPKLEAVCLKCLAKNPADRYATAAALAHDLKVWDTPGAEMLARPSTRIERAWKRVRRVPKFAVAMALIALVGLGSAFLILKDDKPPAKVDLVDAMKQELARDGKLELQGETGRPRWHRFPIGGPELQNALIGDKACSFEALDVTVLELMTEPPEHYKLEGSLRFATSRIGGDPGAHPYCGFFVAGEYSEDPLNEKISLYTLSGLYYEDGPTARDNEFVRFSAARISRHPDVRPGIGTAGLANFQFTPSPTLPGLWRQFEIEVWQNRVVPRGLSEGAFVDFKVGVAGGQLDAPTLQARLDKQEQALRKKPVLGNLPYPRWNPRGAVGIWGYKAAVDFKNVSVTKLP